MAAGPEASRSRAPVRIREITAVDDPSFAEAHQLLRREFPRGEMLPIRDWRNAMRERRERLWTDVAWHLVVAERAGIVIGAASCSYIGNVNVMIVGYVAVNGEARGLGLGPRLRRTLRLRCERDARRAGHTHLKAVVGEVHAGNPWLRSLVRREGAIALDFDYFQPSLAGEKPVPLVLYYQSLERPRSSLSVAELRRLLYTMWRRAYRVPQPLVRPAFRKMLRSLEGRRRIGQRAGLSRPT
jgi:GNAT superfamily N-acetyltransferase